MKEELSYKEDRLRQTKTSHSEELTRLRNANLEVTERNSQMKIKMDEAEQEIKNISMDRDKMRTDLDLSKKRLLDAEKYASRLQAELDEKMEKMKTLEMEVYRVQTQEIERLQKLAEDIRPASRRHRNGWTSASTGSKRLEQENNDHPGRDPHPAPKKNYELEAQCDTVRSQQFAHGGGFSSGSGVGGSDTTATRRSNACRMTWRSCATQPLQDRPARSGTACRGSCATREQEASRRRQAAAGADRKDSQLDKLQLELQRLQQSSRPELRRRMSCAETRRSRSGDQQADKALHDLSAEINKRDRTIEELTRGDVGGRKTDHLMMHGNRVIMSKDRSLADCRRSCATKMPPEGRHRELNQCQRRSAASATTLRDRERQLYELQTERWSGAPAATTGAPTAGCQEEKTESWKKRNE
uniref:Myosin_tail_1 domain-containing protein n=1 Tax=Macrostomum lignano TaxID=282301 RepID=A0A1I8F5Y7_9PLAT